MTSRIEVLNLSKNKLAEKAGVLLGPALADNASIRDLDLSWNSIRRKGATALAQSLKVTCVHFGLVSQSRVSVNLLIVQIMYTVIVLVHLLSVSR